MEATIRKTIDEVFGVDGALFKANGTQSTTTVRVFERNGDTPAMIDGFVFQPDTLRRVMVWMASGTLPETFAKAKMKRNLMVFGPTGCGKTALISQICARTGRSMFRYQCSEDSEAAQMFGSWKLCRPLLTEEVAAEDQGIIEKGFTGVARAIERLAVSMKRVTGVGPEMTFVDGPVLRWARTPNSILLLDEFDQLPPSVAMSLNGALDGDDILVPETGERVKLAPGCLIVATGNTNGRGSAGGNGGSAALYKGVKRQNIASLDRFFVINAGYLSEPEEKALLQGQVGMAEKAAEAMAKLATSVRGRFLGLNEDAGANGEPLEFTITTRNLLNWGLTHRLLMAMGLDSTNAFKEGLRMTLLDFGSNAERQAVLDAWDNIVGEV
ncbi:AAA family ATPase [Cupriavidus sp. TMH.W2]|uniref:AAA family ATPase n=1 Tax=Cupriavidus sp. TMH.W2 TaxID=3434465 RepID=UPI003D78414C